MAPRKQPPFPWSLESSISSTRSSTSLSTNDTAAAAQRVFMRRQAFIKTLGEIMKYFITEMGDDFDVQEWELYKAAEKYIGRSFTAAAEVGSVAGSEVYAAMARYFKIRYKLLVGEIEHHPVRLSARNDNSHKLWMEKCDAEEKLLDMLAEQGDDADLDAAHWLFEQTNSTLDGVFEQIQRLEGDRAATGPSNRKGRLRSSHDRPRRRRSMRESSRLEDSFANYFNPRNSPPSSPTLSSLGPPAFDVHEGPAPHARHGLDQPATPSKFLFGRQDRTHVQPNTDKACKSSAKSKRSGQPSTRVPQHTRPGPSTFSADLPSTPSHSGIDGGVALTDDSDLAYDSDDESTSTRLARATRSRKTLPAAARKQGRTGKGKGKGRGTQPASKLSAGREKQQRPRESKDDEDLGLYRAMGYQFGRRLAGAQARQENV